MCIFIYNLSDAVQLFGGIFHLINRVPEKASLVAQRVKRLPAVQETWVRFLGQEDTLEKEMAAHSSTLAWKIPWTEKPGRLQSMGSPRVRHDWATSLSLFIVDLHCVSFRCTTKWFVYEYICIWILFPYRLLQETEYISSCYKVGLWHLFYISSVYMLIPNW